MDLEQTVIIVMHCAIALRCIYIRIAYTACRGECLKSGYHTRFQYKMGENIYINKAHSTTYLTKGKTYKIFVHKYDYNKVETNSEYLSMITILVIEMALAIWYYAIEYLYL